MLQEQPAAGEEFCKAEFFLLLIIRKLFKSSGKHQFNTV